MTHDLISPPQRCALLRAPAEPGLAPPNRTSAQRRPRAKIMRELATYLRRTLTPQAMSASAMLRDAPPIA